MNSTQFRNRTKGSIGNGSSGGICMENETTVVNQNLQANASKPFHNTVLTTNKHGARASRKREKSEIKTICTQEIKEPVN